MGGKKKRTRVPADIMRQIKIEAGYRCSMPRCGSTHGLQVHHIDENPSNHEMSNLLLFCAVCHSRATSGEVDRKACEMIKSELQMPDNKAELQKMIGQQAALIARLETLVGRQEQAQPLQEEQLGTAIPDPEIDAAIEQVVKFERAEAHLPIYILRPLALQSYRSGNVQLALALQAAIVETECMEAADLYNYGLYLKHTGKKNEAEEAYRKAISADPGFALAWNNLAVLLEESGRRVEAEEAYRCALEADEICKEAWTGSGALLFETGHQEEAERAYRRALEIDPQYGAAWNNLGILLKQAGRSCEAVDAYRNALRNGERDPEILNGFAYFLWETGRATEAEEVVRQALEMDANHSYANATLGLLLFEKDELNDGRTRYERAIELRPDDLPLQQKFHYEYGRALSRNGDEKSARAELMKAKNIQADYVPVADIDAEIAKLGMQK